MCDYGKVIKPQIIKSKGKMFFSRPTPIGGREIHIGLLGEGGGRREGGPLAQPIGSQIILERLGARPGHRAVSICMDCVLVSF